MNTRWKQLWPYLAAWLGAILAALALLALTRFETQEDLQRNEHATRRELSNLTRLTQEHASRTLHAADQALQLVRALYLRDGMKLDLGQWVRQGAVDVSIFHQVGIIDDQGVYRLSNLPATPQVNLADREHFRVHLGHTDDRLFISKPVLGRVSGKWTIQLTRPIIRADGRFAGVAVVSVDADYFNQFYASLKLGPQGAASLMGLDSVVRARHSLAVQGLGGNKLTQTPASALLASGQTEGFYVNTSQIDQISRLNHLRKLEGYPLYVTVAYSLSDYQGAAQAEQAIRWQFAALGCGLLLLLAALFTWHRWREQRYLQALQSSHIQMNLALDGGGLGLWEWDLVQGRFKVDERLKELFGFAPDELAITNESFMTRLHPDDVLPLRQALLPVLKGEVSRLVLEHRLWHRDGHWVWLMARGKVVERDAQGRALRLMGTDVDRSEQKIDEERRRIAAVAFESNSAMAVSDAQQVILRVNQAFVDLTGFSAEEAVGQQGDILKSGRQDAVFFQSMWDNISRTGHWEGEIWNRRKNGEVFLDWLSITVVKNVQGQVTHYVSVHTDITLRKRTEEDIRKLAFFDPLTNLPNRRLLLDRLQQMCAACDRNSQLAAVLFIDLDRFKLLNDTHGHDQGDELLIQVAQRLQACVREVDTVARLGGDEFVVALAQLGDAPAQAQASAMRVAQKILQTLSEPFVLNAVTWSLSGSIGVAMISDAKTVPEEVLKHADEAMYAAKAAGRHAVQVWTDPVLSA